MNARNQSEEQRQAQSSQSNVQQEAHRTERAQDQGFNPFEELNPEREGTQEGSNKPRTGRGRRRDEENTAIEEEEEKKEEKKNVKETQEKEESPTKLKKDNETKKSEGKKVTFNFEAHGLDQNFLEKNGIDPDFFNELDDELKLEIISEYTNKAPQSASNNQSQRNQPSIQTQQSREDTNNSIAREFLNALNSTMASLGGNQGRPNVELSNNNNTTALSIIFKSSPRFLSLNSALCS